MPQQGSHCEMRHDITFREQAAELRRVVVIERMEIGDDLER